MLRTINLNILIIVGSFCLLSCATVPAREQPPLKVVSSVNINKYLGRWHEIARYPNWFQENCYA
ncbi:lipocalin family protein, partial [Nitrospinaceae bacterium]|nr:lipocalin family protein [Nitrospinaceae bacterium]